MTQLERAFELACIEIAEYFYDTKNPSGFEIEAIKDDLMYMAQISKNEKDRPARGKRA